MNPGKVFAHWPLYEFDTFRLDPRERAFSVTRRVFALTPKAVDTLLGAKRGAGGDVAWRRRRAATPRPEGRERRSASEVKGA
jgi:hypothetical protein